MKTTRPGETPPAGFERVTPAPGLTMLVAGGLDPEDLVGQILAPRGGVPSRHVGRAALYTVTLPDGGHGLVRSYRHGGWFRRLTRDWFIGRPLRPFAELAVTATARERGLAVPEVLAALVARVCGPWYRGWLVTRELEGARDLWAVLQGDLSVAEKQLLLGCVGRLLRKMHTSGIDHADLNLRNILVRANSPRPDVHLIDFDKARLYQGPVPVARAQRNLRRLLRSVNKLDGGQARVAAADWECLAEAYRTSG